MFVFHMFSQYPMNENNLFCINTVINTITFSLKKTQKIIMQKTAFWENEENPKQTEKR